MEVLSVSEILDKGKFYDISICGDEISIMSNNHKIILNYTDGNTVSLIQKVGRGLVYCRDSNKDGSSLETVLFLNYHNHSTYSIGDGVSKLEGLAKKAESVLGVTEHGNCFSVLKWQNAMKSENKRPVFGCELYCETVDGKKEGNHLIVLVKNEQGKKNLFKLTSNAYYNFYNKPHVSLDMLKEYKDGLVVTSACLGGEISRLLALDKYEEAKKVSLIYKDIFGEDFYLEIQRHDIFVEKRVNEGLISLSKETGIKLVAANDSHYLNKDDSESHEVLLCVSQKKSMFYDHFKFDGTGYHLFTQEEMIRLFWDLPEAIANTQEIIKKCASCEIETGKYHLPVYEIPEGYESDIDYLKYLILKGYDERFLGTDKYSDDVYKSRLEYEMDIMLSMGYSNYFLIVWDYIRYARDNGILVGPGRGSAAGSLVSFCLKITDLDPIENGLLFERFLNPERVSMPDIDIDFEYERRHEVVNYCKQKYGEDRVCNIITFGTMAAKMVVKDVGRVYEQSYLADSIAKTIPSEPGMTLKKAEENSLEFEAIVNNTNSETSLLMKHAYNLEGNIRHTSQHACGVVVAPSTISDYMPTALITVEDEETKEKYKSLVSQVTMTEVEDLGLLKMDFLGLKTLTVIKRSLWDINKVLSERGLSTIDDYREISLYDPYVYEEISKGKSYAVFQIESAGMRSFMKDLFKDVRLRIETLEQRYGLKGYYQITGTGHKKDEYIEKMTSLGRELFERMVAGISLYRPGPMDYIDNYLEGIRNPDEIVYDSELLEPILKPTYGVIVYQEQVMQIVRDLAGFSLGQSDTIRKAMGKKKQYILDEYMPYFIYGSGDAVDSHTGNKLNIKGCIANGISEDIAIKIWEQMADFAKYAFNKSHAAVYAVLTVTCAWLKHYYPVIYMSAVINTYMADTKKLKANIGTAKDMGIDMLSPDINKSSALFKVEDNCIRFGLKGISKVGRAVVYAIDKERDENGEFTDIHNFVERMTKVAPVNKGVLQSLIYAGAFDCFGHTRNSLLAVVESVLNEVARDKKDSVAGQLSLMDLFSDLKEDMKIKVPSIPEMDMLELIKKEKEIANMYISYHPLDIYKEEIKTFGFSTIEDSMNERKQGRITIAGIITEQKTIYTKKDNLPMKLFTLEDKSCDISCIVFNKQFENCSRFITEDSLVFISGTIEYSEDRGWQIIVESVGELSALKGLNPAQNIYVRVLDESSFRELQGMCYPLRHGNGSVKAQYNNKLYLIKENVSLSGIFAVSLVQKFGTENVIVK